MSKVVVHAGFVKTATSTLQHGVFSRHEDINFLGLPAPDDRLGAAIHAIAKADSTVFDRERDAKVLRDRLARGADAKVNLLSYENFTLYESRDKGLVARRLLDIFGDCKIIFTLRRQHEMVAAWYLQKLPKYILGNNFVDFDHWIELKVQEPHKSILGDLDFDATVRCYEELFGRANVELFFFEQLRQDPAGFAARMAGHLGVDPARFHALLLQAHYNPTITRRQHDFGRLTTTFLPRLVADRGSRLIPRRLRRRFKAFLKRGPSAQAPRSQALDAWIAERCRAGNRALDARYGGQLARYGYVL